ncbi:MAG: peptidoglycan-binding protein [Candidatus Omnitrophica bacterium]|nr:peptidoglycan-binding protein [Candidatus Omnitrophota bacterium]
MTVQKPAAIQTSQPVSAVAEVHETTTAISEKYTFEQKVQIALRNANLYSGAIDGKIGPKTREAIKQFQISKGLNADGLAGKQTWAVLREQYYKE